MLLFVSIASSTSTHLWNIKMQVERDVNTYHFSAGFNFLQPMTLSLFKGDTMSLSKE